MDRPTFLVMDPFVVIAQDIAHMIAEAMEGGAVVLVAMTEAEAEAVAADVGPIALAVLNVAPDRFAQSALYRTLAERDTAIILIGDMAEQWNGRAGFPVLHRPYAPEEVITLVRRTLSDKRPV